jgi:sulfite reductase beta subunit-like hemoprotein
MYPQPDVTQDRCPGVLRLHTAADGHVARIRLPGGRLDATGLRAVSTVATRGNGVVELTSRASLQVRGLRNEDATWAADQLWGAGLFPSFEHDRVRNILASPFGGRHPGAALRTDDLVTQLDRDLCGDRELSQLPGRFLFLVEDGRRTLGLQRADVALVACEGKATLRLDLAGCPTTLEAAPADAPSLALEAAHAFLDLLRADGGDGWRIDDLGDGAGRVARALGGGLDGEAVPVAADGRVIPGELEQSDGRRAITALVPLGRLGRTTLVALSAMLDDGVGELRLSPLRTLTIVDVPADRAQGVTQGLEVLGLIVGQDSGWDGISACAGLGACVNARLDVRAAAASRVPARKKAMIPVVAEHWAACERGCGRPASAVLVSATADGLRVERGGVQTGVATVEHALALLASEAPSA